MKLLKQFREFTFKNLISVLTVLLGVVLTVIASVAKWPTEQIVAAMFWLLTAMATSELYDRAKKLNDIERKLDSGFQTVLSRGDIQVVVLPNYSSGYAYMAGEISWNSPRKVESQKRRYTEVGRRNDDRHTTAIYAGVQARGHSTV